MISLVPEKLIRDRNQPCRRKEDIRGDTLQEVVDLIEGLIEHLDDDEERLLLKDIILQLMLIR